MSAAPPSAAPAARAAGADGQLSVVLVIARYPPHHLGGYELRCRDVARALAARGHRVTVVTSREGRRGVDRDEGVRVVRELHLRPEGVGAVARVPRFALDTAADCRRLRGELRRARADVVAYWHLAGLTSALLAVPRPRGCGVLCDVSSDWLLEVAGNGGNWFRIFEKPSSTPLRRAGKSLLLTAASLLGAPTVRPRVPPGRAYFTSRETLKRYLDAGLPLEDAALIRSGIDLERFRFVPRPAPDGAVRLLFLGRIKRRKGLHAAVLALGDLPPGVRLRVVGTPEDPAYLAELAELARAARVTDRVEISGPVPHAEVPALLAAADVLVFPSEEPEAFSRLVLEAFAVGTPVVGTTLGGTVEVLREAETGLTFAPGNARELGSQLARLLADRALRNRIVHAARRLVEERYGLGYTVDQIERLLREAAAAERGAPAPLR